jgi:hypothetical protein
MSALQPPQQRFVDKAIRRSRLFLWLSIVGVLVGTGLLIHAGLQWVQGLRGVGSFVLGILVLLNGRQNLRQHKYAEVLRALGAGSVDLKSGDDGQVV